MSTDLCFQTATELARRIRTKDVSVTEVVEAHLAQIARGAAVALACGMVQLAYAFEQATGVGMRRPPVVRP